jgi:hypothetical protein
VTYRAIPSPTRRFSRVIRAVAAIDLALATVVAVPFTSAALVTYLFRIDSWLGFATRPADLLPSFVLPLNIAGLIAVSSAVGRLAEQTLLTTRLDVLRRLVVAALILYYVLLRDQTPVLLAVVVTEMAAAILQGLAARRFARTTGV